jgi:hypothetical protein
MSEKWKMRVGLTVLALGVVALFWISAVGMGL